MNKRRVGEDRGSKETDRCPFTDSALHFAIFPGGWEGVCYYPSIFVLAWLVVK
jgi:hypothetical protein